MSTFDKRNHDFCKALTDMQFAYVEAEAENAKLRELTSLMWRELHAEQGSAQRRMEIADRLRELEIGGG